MGKPAHNSKPGKGGGGGGGGRGREKKPQKHGKRVFKEKKQEYLKKQLKKEVKRQVTQKELLRKEGEQDTIKVAWRGKQQEVDTKKLAGDKKGRDILKKISQKRVLSADEKHRLKMLGPTGDLMKLWETLREKNQSKEDKEVAMKQILEFTKDTFVDDVRKPDMSRIFQSVLKWGDASVRTEVFNRVKDVLVELCTSAHSNQFAKSLLEYSTTETREMFLKEIMKAGGKILSQKHALLVLEHLVGKCNAEKQNMLICSFLDGIEVKTMKGYPRLADIFENLDPSTLDYKRLIEKLHRVISPSLTKGAFDNTIIHRLLELLLRFGTDFEVTDIMDEVSKGVVNICRTKPGSAAALLIMSHASNSTRKSIIKSFQHSVVDMCCAKGTPFFISRIFDIFDDTDALTKFVLKEMIRGLSDLVVDPQGSIPLLHLLTPDPERKKKYITFVHFDTLWNQDTPNPQNLHCLSAKYTPQEKKICNTHPSKKHQVILQVLIPALTTVILKDVDSMVSNVISRRVVTELLHYASTHKTKANKTALQSIQAALDKRVDEQKEKSSKRTSEAADKQASETAPPAKRARTAAKKAEPTGTSPKAAPAKPASGAPAKKKALKRVVKKAA